MDLLRKIQGIIRTRIDILIKDRIPNKNGDIVSSYCHRNTESLGDIHVLRVNEKENLYFQSVAEIFEWLIQEGWD